MVHIASILTTAFFSPYNPHETGYDTFCEFMDYSTLPAREPGVKVALPPAEERFLEREQKNVNPEFQPYVTCLVF
jgi:hypothetical protein